MRETVENGRFFYLDEVTKYAKKVVAGEIRAGRSVIKACRRHLEDLKKSKRKDFLYYFDAEEAEHVFLFSETFCRHSKGEWAGKPVVLEDWQKFCLGCIFGWKKKKDDTRRFVYFYIQVARKNGKSTLMAVVGLYVLVCDGEGGAEIYSAATKKDQAKIIFTEAKNMVNASAELKKVLNVYTNNISFDAMLSKFEPLSADAQTLDGLNVHLGLIDEYHAHKNSDVFDILDSAKGARRQPIIGICTTAGKNPSSVCHEYYEMCKNVLAGTEEKDDLFVYIAELDEGDDWTDENVWIKANPNMGVSVYAGDMRTMCQTAKTMMTAQNEFKCKKLNMWVNAERGWIDIDKYNLCPDDLSADELLGKDCYVGCDLATRNDLASVTAEFPLGNGFYACISHSFMPEEKIFEASKRDNMNYRALIERGYITATHGASVDFDYIEEYIRGLRDKYNVLEVCIDPWNASQLEKHLLDEDFVVVEVRMGFKTLSEPTKDLESVITNRRLYHFADPLLKWAVGNVVCIEDENANVRPAKSKSNKKIDPAMSLIIAHTRAYTHSENYIDAAQQIEKYIDNLKGMF